MDQKLESKNESQKRIESLVSAIESILFMAGEPVKKETLIKVLEIDDSLLKTVIDYLLYKHNQNDSGLEVVERKDDLQFITKAKNYNFIRKALKTEKFKPLSKPVYEVLAIIAYNQPVTRIDVELIRGVNSVSAIQRLLDLGLIEESGRKEVAGSPYLYKTTDYFLQKAKISSIDELPSYKDFKDQIKEMDKENE